MSKPFQKNDKHNNEESSTKGFWLKGVIILIGLSLFGIIKHPEKVFKNIVKNSDEVITKVLTKNSSEVNEIISVLPKGAVRFLGSHTTEAVNRPENQPRFSLNSHTETNIESRTKSTLRNNMILEGFYSSFDKSVEPGFFIIELMKMPEDGRLDYIKNLYSYILSDNIPMKEIDEMSENYLTEFNEMLKNKDELYYVHFNKISSLEHHKSN